MNRGIYIYSELLLLLTNCDTNMALLYSYLRRNNAATCCLCSSTQILQFKLKSCNKKSLKMELLKFFLTRSEGWVYMLVKNIHSVGILIQNMRHPLKIQKLPTYPLNVQKNKYPGPIMAPKAPSDKNNLPLMTQICQSVTPIGQ